MIHEPKIFKTRAIYTIAEYKQDFYFERMRENKETVFEYFEALTLSNFIASDVPNEYWIDPSTSNTYYRLQSRFPGWGDHMYARDRSTIILVEDEYGFSPYVISRGMSVKEIDYQEKIQEAKQVLIDAGLVVGMWPKEKIRSRVEMWLQGEEKLSAATSKSVTDNVCDILNGDNDSCEEFGLCWDYVDNLIQRELADLEEIDELDESEA